MLATGGHVKGAEGRGPRREGGVTVTVPDLNEIVTRTVPAVSRRGAVTGEIGRA